MVKKIIYNIVIIIVLIMIGLAIVKANKPKSNLPEASLSSIQEQKSGLNPKEAKYYRVIEE